VPQIVWKVELGTILTVACLLFSVGGLYARMDSRISSIDDNGTKVVKELKAELVELKIALVRTNAEINLLRQQLSQREVAEPKPKTHKR
jgi:hypothetical protein